MKSKKLMVPLTMLVVLSSLLFIAPAAHAQSSGGSNTNFFSGLINYIAQKFGLDKTQVTSAVNDYKNQNKPTPRPTLTPDQIQAREKARLDKLVSAKTITSAQEQLILDEETALRTKYNPANFKNLTPDQRKQQFQQEQTDIKTWATANNIDPKYLMPGFGGPMMGGMHGRGGFGNWNKVTPTPTP